MEVAYGHALWDPLEVLVSVRRVPARSELHVVCQVGTPLRAFIPAEQGK